MWTRSGSDWKRKCRSKKQTTKISEIAIYFSGFVGVRGGWNEVERECGMGMSGGVKAMKIQH